MIERLQESSANLALDIDAQEEATPDLSIKMQAPLTTFPHIDLPLPIPLPAKLSDLHCSSSTSDTAIVLGRLSKVTGLGSAAVRVSRKHVKAQIVLQEQTPENEEATPVAADAQVALHITQLSSNASRYRKASTLATEDHCVANPMEWVQLKKGKSATLQHGDEFQLHSTVPIRSENVSY